MNHSSQSTNETHPAHTAAEIGTAVEDTVTTVSSDTALELTIEVVSELIGGAFSAL